MAGRRRCLRAAWEHLMEAGGSAGERPRVAQRVLLPHWPLVFSGSSLASKRCRMPLPHVPPPHKTKTHGGEGEAAEAGEDSGAKGGYMRLAMWGWGAGAGAGFTNQPLRRDAVPDCEASKLQAGMKNTPSQAGARDPACHITPVSSAGRGRGRHVGHGGTRYADQRMRETILGPDAVGAAAVTSTSRHPALPRRGALPKPNRGEIYVAVGSAGTQARGGPNTDARADTITFKGSPPTHPRLAARECRLPSPLHMACLYRDGTGAWCLREWGSHSAHVPIREAEKAGWRMCGSAGIEAG